VSVVVLSSTGRATCARAACPSVGFATPRVVSISSPFSSPAHAANYAEAMIIWDYILKTRTTDVLVRLFSRGSQLIASSCWYWLSLACVLLRCHVRRVHAIPVVRSALVCCSSALLNPLVLSLQARRKARQAEIAGQSDAVSRLLLFRPCDWLCAVCLVCVY
jgi:hypothetical protein